MRHTIVYDTYWHFAAERLAMYYRRLDDARGPWTTDVILQTYRFTNTYRGADRVSQYLIREVQYHPDRSQHPQEVFFRTLLFKIFNKIETWEILERAHGPIELECPGLGVIDQTLSGLASDGQRIYSAAYIMPAPPLGHVHKHTNHLKLIEKMMLDGLPERVRRARSLRSVYEQLLSYPGLGRFLAFQYTVDLNYSTLLEFPESDLVIAGPGALDGISKCFGSSLGWSPERIIEWVTEEQTREFAARRLCFPGLYGRPLQPIDCQNLFCEVSKYARIAHPNVVGIANRQRVKQTYKPSVRPILRPFFPPRWGLTNQSVI